MKGKQLLFGDIVPRIVPVKAGHVTAANVHLKDGQSNGGTLAEYLSEPVTVSVLNF